MGKRKVSLSLDGIEVIGIRCRIDTHANRSYLYYNDAQKLDPCVYCGKPSQTWEHITPRGLGGGERGRGGRGSQRTPGGRKDCLGGRVVGSDLAAGDGNGRQDN